MTKIASLTSFERNGRGLLCLGKPYDPTLVATKSHASIASHTRTATTLKTDAGVVGSVTVDPRATQATGKMHGREERRNHGYKQQSLFSQ